jgi:hypothetical protein
VSISFRRFRPEDRPGIAALNERLSQKGMTDRVYPEPDAMPATAEFEPVVKQELYVAADGAAIHGGVWLHEQNFLIGGTEVKVGWLKYPVSESLIDRAYSGVPAGLILTLMRRQPLLMALGMGGRSAPLARLLEGIGWTLTDVPFGVAPLRATRVLNELRVAHRRQWVAKGIQVVARTHTAPLAVLPINLVRRSRVRRCLADVTVTHERTFSAWADELWQQHANHYPFVGRRDARMLNRMYPEDAPGILRLRVARGGRDAGWVCIRTMGASHAARHPQFGSLKVGMVVDALADPRDSKVVFAAAVRELTQQRVDLIVSNQLHPVWQEAMKSLLLAPAPSNFVFAYTKSMKTLMADSKAQNELYVTRGDCDGPPWW